VPIDKFYFIAIDKASLDIGIYGISPEFVEEGERGRQWRLGLNSTSSSSS
jgi:hypothetical protein